MCATFRRGILFRVAIAMAFLAVLAFVAPPVALAFVPAKDAIYCLTYDDHRIGREHHDRPADQHYSGNVDQATHSHGDAKHGSRCCGLFCVTALAPETRQMVHPLPMGSESFPIIDPGINSLTPELPFRPPIPPLSV